MNQNKIKAYKILEELSEIDNDDKSIYLLINAALFNGFHDGDYWSCEKEVKNLQKMKMSKNAISEFKTIELINQVIDYFESIMTSLALCGRKPKERDLNKNSRVYPALAYAIAAAKYAKYCNYQKIDKRYYV